MKLRLSISPCPNDTFMFDAMINGRIDTEGLEFDLRFADIEQLNANLIGPTSADNVDNSTYGNSYEPHHRIEDTPQNGEYAMSGSMEYKPHISKASYAVYSLIADSYTILDSGSALGEGNGPLLVTADEDADLMDYSMRVAIPGVHTTANLLMNRLYPHIALKYPYIFSDIMKTVSSGICDAGVLIHEGRFTYHNHGLLLLADLGVEWGKATGLPLPLGAIVASRELPEAVRNSVERVLRRSIEYAFAHPEDSAEFVRSHAQELSPEVIRQHIALFVNDYSLSLGDQGRMAINALLGMNAFQ